jgi:serine/threonine-protein kinase
MSYPVFMPAAAPPPAHDPFLGTKLDGRYLVQERLGAGAMGTVYRCRHVVLRRDVAIKLINPEFAEQPQAIPRFVTEARAASAVGNQHIVEVLDVWQTPEGVAYCVMEYLDGPTLRELLSGRALAPELVCDIGAQIAEGLAATHSQGIIHRDLKPDNLFVLERDGRPFVKIVDFGIAKMVHKNGQLTEAGTVFGTPYYMAPEQAMGQTADHRSDIYSLGVVLYEMLCGQVPFDGPSAYAIASQHITQPPPPLAPRLVGTAAPPPLVALVERCLEKRPEDRPASMEEVMRTLAAFRAEPQLGAVSTVQAATWTDTAPRVAPRRRRVLRTVGISLALVAAAAAGLAGFEWRAGRLPERMSRLQESVGVSLARLGVGSLAHAEGPAFELPPPAAPERVVALPPESGAEAPVRAEPAPAPPTITLEELEPALHKVDLILFPLGAKVFEGDKELGQMPVSVELEPGATRTLDVKHFGFQTQRIVVDESMTRVVVTLRKRPAGQAAHSAPSAGSPHSEVSED